MTLNAFLMTSSAVPDVITGLQLRTLPRVREGLSACRQLKSQVAPIVQSGSTVGQSIFSSSSQPSNVKGPEKRAENGLNIKNSKKEQEHKCES